MIIEPKTRGFICVTAHPEGCAAHVREQITHVKKGGNYANGPKRVLVVGSSTGYGLSSRIAAAFGSDAATIGVFFEKSAENGKLGTAGWYNSAAFEKEAHAQGLYAKSINGDAFSDEIKQKTIEIIKKDLGSIDCLIYSLASPRRSNPRAGTTHKSVLKPIGTSYTSKTVDTDKGTVSEITLEAASQEEIADTVATMGGEDWQWWIEALAKEGLLAEGFTTVAYSYIGPVLTHAIYKNGSIGKAKEDLEASCKKIGTQISSLKGRAYISVNKALVTQASSAIPVVPLYISLLYKIMKEKGLHEGCGEQIDRLFRDFLYNGNAPLLDEANRIRIDDWEMKPEIQDAVSKLWPIVSTENLAEISDIAGYRAEFLKLFGFGLPGVDYKADADPSVAVPSLAAAESLA